MYVSSLTVGVLSNLIYDSLKFKDIFLPKVMDITDHSTADKLTTIIEAELSFKNFNGTKDIESLIRQNDKIMQQLKTINKLANSQITNISNSNCLTSSGNVYILDESLAERKSQQETNKENIPQSIISDQIHFDEMFSDVHKDIFIAGISLISLNTHQNIFINQIEKGARLNLLINTNEESIVKYTSLFCDVDIKFLNQLIYTGSLNAESFKKYGNVSVKYINSILVHSIVAIDYNQLDGKIYIQPYAYKVNHKKLPQYVHFQGDKWYDSYLEEIKNLWYDGCEKMD